MKMLWIRTKQRILDLYYDYHYWRAQGFSRWQSLKKMQ